MLLLASSLILALVATAAILATALPYVSQAATGFPFSDPLTDRGTGELAMDENTELPSTGGHPGPLSYIGMGLGTGLAALAIPLILTAWRLHRPPKQPTTAETA